MAPFPVCIGVADPMCEGTYISRAALALSVRAQGARGSQSSTGQPYINDPSNIGLQTFDAGFRRQMFIGAIQPRQPFSMVCCSCCGGIPLPCVSDQVLVAQQLADNTGAQAPHSLCAAARTDLAGCRGGYDPHTLRTAGQQALSYKVFVTAQRTGLLPFRGSWSPEVAPSGEEPGADQFSPCCD